MVIEWVKGDFICIMCEFALLMNLLKSTFNPFIAKLPSYKSRHSASIHRTMISPAAAPLLAVSLQAGLSLIVEHEDPVAVQLVAFSP
jgi:hypothetical protein